MNLCKNKKLNEIYASLKDDLFIDIQFKAGKVSILIYDINKNIVKTYPEQISQIDDVTFDLDTEGSKN